MSNINWVQAIMDNAPKQTQLGGDPGFSDDVSAPPPSPLQTDADAAASQVQQAVNAPPPKQTVKLAAKVAQTKPALQAVHKQAKPPSVQADKKADKPKQHSQTNISHKKNTTSHASPIR
jgi:hypothetical protein